MKRAIVCLTLLMLCNNAYSAEYFQTKDVYNTILRVQNVNKMYKNCKRTSFDRAYWAFDSTDNKHYTYWYDNDFMCQDDFNKFSQKVYEYDYKICAQHGGGSACINRK